MSGTNLTRRQQGILDYIDTANRERGYPPSVREIGEAVGLSSPSTVHSHLNSLQKAGYLAGIRPNRVRSKFATTPTPVR